MAGFVIFSLATLVNARVTEEVAPTVVFDRTLTRRVAGVVATAALALPLIVTVVSLMLAGTVVPVGNFTTMVSPDASPPVPVVKEIVYGVSVLMTALPSDTLTDEMLDPEVITYVFDCTFDGSADVCTNTA